MMIMKYRIKLLFVSAVLSFLGCLQLFSQTASPKNDKSVEFGLYDLQKFDLQTIYHQIDSISDADKDDRPLVGISSDIHESSMDVLADYVAAVEEAGGQPVIIPTCDHVKYLDALISHLDGLILTGGEDVSPIFYGEDPDSKLGHLNLFRDYSDIIIIRLAIRHKLPILGICRGMQLMNVAMGGSLWQDISMCEHGFSIKHRQDADKSTVSHLIKIKSGSLLYNLVGKKEIFVNSFHHQCVKNIADGFRVTACAVDSVPEAIEGLERYNFLGVQFHPEGLFRQDPSMLNIFKNLIERSKLYQLNKK